MKAAVFCMAKNEKEWLPVWVRHYLRQGFNPTDIYVLDHLSTDGSTSDLRQCNRFLMTHEKLEDHQALLDTVKWFHTELLRKYDIVVFSESDEFICADPGKWANLIAYLSKCQHTCVELPFYQVVHDTLNAEPWIDFSKPILSQRHLWVGPVKGKTLISKIPMDWIWGFHQATPQGTLDPDVRIIHGRWIDREYQIFRLQSRLRAMQDAGDYPTVSANNRTTDVSFHFDEFDRVLHGRYQFPHDQRHGVMPTEIPPEWRSFVV